MVRQGHSAELSRSPHHLVRLFAHHPEQRRRTVLFIFTAAAIGVLAGCEPVAVDKDLLVEGKELFTVDFQQGQTLRYKFVSSRDINIDWEPTKKTSKKRSKRDKDTTGKSSESMEMVVAYTPIEVDPYGLTTIKATCESVKVRRSKSSPKDAVESLPGKTFILSVGPTGRIEDYSQLEELIREIGKKAFRPDPDSRRIKEPDMICDFIVTQWFLWDSVSSIVKASEGVSVGQTWKSKLSVPGPMVMRKARDVTYTLTEIRETEKGRLAVIRSSYEKTDSIPDRWPPWPYIGRFRVSGTFGFLKANKILDLQGKGEELFNIDAGRIEQYNQQYQVQLEAYIPMGIRAKPQVTIKQNLSMQLL